MQDKNVLSFIKSLLKNRPTDWLNLTTHRLDIYNEKRAKTEFLTEFEALFIKNDTTELALKALPTAYDYIRLGHPLSCVLEWAIGKLYHVNANHVITFSSSTTPILAVLRKNLLKNKSTTIFYKGKLPHYFDAEIIREVYGYNFNLIPVKTIADLTKVEGSAIFISQEKDLCTFNLNPEVDFYINFNDTLGSILLVNGEANSNYISEIQHVRRRETIAMTPANCLVLLNLLVGNSDADTIQNNTETHKIAVQDAIKKITATTRKPIVGSSGLSVQYAIMMGLIHDAIENHKGKAIKFIVPPNCYGGTNDQARRVAACLDNVEIVDLPVDGANDMVQSIDRILNTIAEQDAIPFIIAEIPTNPRVEVPNLDKLKAVLSIKRKTPEGKQAIAPVFILDQTFCPNIQFLKADNAFSTIKTISYASGSKFPSGGQCTAGYCVANEEAQSLMDNIELHLNLCDNEATALQYKILAKQLPSMNQRIIDAYLNARAFVNFIHETLPEAKINFVSEELAQQDFTPSVFSLDLPTKGTTDEERETYKRALNLKLINLMITKIPDESKFCVSYGQLKGCYWTIPATSTQGTTKEGDKDYIVRASLSANMNLEKHKEVFLEFVEGI